MLETAMASLAEVKSSVAVKFSKAVRCDIFEGRFPWGASAFGQLEVQSELLKRFGRVRCMLERINEEHELLRVEAVRSVMFFDKCGVVIEEGISELTAPAEPPTEPTAEWALAEAERVAKAYLLRKHLSTFKGLAFRARKLWSAWAPDVSAPADNMDVDADAGAARARDADDGAGGQ